MSVMKTPKLKMKTLESKYTLANIAKYFYSYQEKYALVLDKRPKLQWHNEIFVIFMNPRPL